MNNLRLILDISRHLLLGRLRQSIVAAVGVTFGIAMFITLMSFMTGLNQLLDDLILNRTPHIRLYNEIEAIEQQPSMLDPEFRDDVLMIRSIKPKDSGPGLYNAPEVLKTLRSDDRVLGVAPKVITQVFYHAGATDIAGAINGIDPEEEHRLYHFGDYVPQGDIADLDQVNNSIILGMGLAEKMLVGPGDVVVVTNTRGERITLKVVGLYQSGIADFDNINSFTSLNTAQKLLGKTNSYITDLQVKLHDLDLAPQLARDFSVMFRCDAVDIQEANAQYDTGSSIRNTITYAVSITLLIVAGFGIYNVMNMMIYEKMDSIAILKATGFSGGDVQRIFISLALILGISGGILGLLAGFGMTAMIDQVPFETSALPTITTYPILYKPNYYVTGILFALSTTFLAGYFPARKASKIDPVEIIRGK